MEQLLERLNMQTISYCRPAKNRMENLQILISDTTDPIFIIDRDSRKITLGNESAISGCQGYDPTGDVFEDIVYLEEEVADPSNAFFNDRWYELHSKSFSWEGKEYLKIALKEREDLPGEENLETLQNMIAVLLHCFRSPLTGMQGYLELLQNDLVKESDIRRIGKLTQGIDRLFDLMDELEILHKISANTEEKENYSVDPEIIIREILFSYPTNIRKRIQISKPGETAAFNCNPSHLKKILSILIKNAIEHLSEEDGKISVDILSNRTLRVSHGGEPIPESIAERIFYPFVTDKVNNLGIGLTMALLYANQARGSIYLSGNSKDDGISFTLNLPPF